MPFTSCFLSRISALLSCVLLCCAVKAQEPDVVPDANPGRPTVSTPATLTPVGYLQFESGGLYARHSGEFSTRFEVNEVVKLAVHERLQALLLIEPVVKATKSSSDSAKPGEVFVGAQGVLMRGEERRPTLSANYIYRTHASPAPELDYGTYRQGFMLLLSGDVKGFHADLNGMLNEQISDETGARRGQFGQSLAVSHPVGRFIVSGELWHFTQPLIKGNAVGNLWSAAFPVRKNLVVDAAYEHGLTSTSTRWQTTLGISYLLPKQLLPWKQHRG